MGIVDSIPTVHFFETHRIERNILVSTPSSVLSLRQLLDQQPTPKPYLLGPGILPHQGILFVGGEPKVGKSILVANLALALAAGKSRAGFEVPNACRVLFCQFELPTEQLVTRLNPMRQPLGTAADNRLLVDTRSQGHFLSTTEGFKHFLDAAKEAEAQVIILDPLYSTHDKDENDTRAMTALCQTLLRLRDKTKASLIVVHHVKKSVSRHEVGTAFRGSGALHAVGDSYLLFTRHRQQQDIVELRFQFRYAPAQKPRRLRLDPKTLWFESADHQPPPLPDSRRKVENNDVKGCFNKKEIALGFNQLLHKIMTQTPCSKRTAQLAIKRACHEGAVHHQNGQYLLPL